MANGAIISVYVYVYENRRPAHPSKSAWQLVEAHKSTHKTPKLRRNRSRPDQYAGEHFPRSVMLALEPAITQTPSEI